MNIAIILAGGVGSRMHSDGLPKQYVEVASKPVLIYSLEAFQACQAIDHIVIVASAPWKETISAWCKEYGITKFSALADSGETRQESVLSGLLVGKQFASCDEDIALIHDSARPLITPHLIEDCIETTKVSDGCLPVITVKDTVFFSRNGQTIEGLADRSALFCGQTPEAFKLLPYLKNNLAASVDQLKKIRGCSELAFLNGCTIRMIPGDETNFKLTTQEDMDRFRTICSLAAKQD